MSRILAASALTLALVAGLPAAASAQSYNAPAGIPAATAPGGLEGIDGYVNAQRFSQPTPSVGARYTSGSAVPARAVRARIR